MAKQVDLAAIKTRLLSKKEELKVRLDKLDADLQHRNKPLDKDFAEQAVERENEEVLEQLAQTSRQEIRLINQALDRIDEGDYTICASCGEDIPMARLEAIPFTEFCVDCAELKDR